MEAILSFGKDLPAISSSLCIWRKQYSGDAIVSAVAGRRQMLLSGERSTVSLLTIIWWWIIL